MGVIDTLIMDRTQTDVAKITDLLSKPRILWTAIEWEYFLNGDYPYYPCLDGELECSDGYLTVNGTLAIRGAYNAQDLNRVLEAMEYLAERFRGYGYRVPEIERPDLNGRGTWAIGDIPNNDLAFQYLKNVRVLRDINGVMRSTPSVPKDMEGLTYSEANDIELILRDVDYLLTDMVNNWFYTAEAFCGEV